MTFKTKMTIIRVVSGFLTGFGISYLKSNSFLTLLLALIPFVVIIFVTTYIEFKRDEKEFKEILDRLDGNGLLERLKSMKEKNK